MMSHSRIARLLVAGYISGVLFSGCNGSERYIDAHRGDAGLDEVVSKKDAGATRSDAGMTQTNDGGVDLDGATMDAAVLGLDASLNLPKGTLILPDGKLVLPDGEVIDVDAAIARFAPEVDVSTCGTAGEDPLWSAKVEFSDQGGFSLIPGFTGFSLAFHSSNGTNCWDSISTAAFTEASTFPLPLPVLTDCPAIGDLALLTTEQGAQLAFVDNSTGTDELHGLALTSDLKRAVGAKRTAINAVDAIPEREAKPALAEVNGRVIATWITRNPQGTGDTISSRVLGTDGTTTEVLSAMAGHRPVALAFATMSTHAAALAWVSVDQEPGVWLQKLDQDGAPVESPIRLSEAAVPSSSVSVASRENGGAVLYSVAPANSKQVRFFRLDENGAPTGVEKDIVETPLSATGASLYPLGGGYAVTYRALPGGGVTASEIRLTFITKEGNVQTDPAGHLLSTSIAPCDPSDGRTQVAVSVEGYVMVAWVDNGDPSSNEKLLKLVRRRLNCQ